MSGHLFQLEHVHFAYAGHEVLQDISLQFQAGRFYGLLGPNGSGKTTLLDLMFRHKQPQTGRLSLGTQDIKNYSRRALARNMALVPQSDQVNFPFSVHQVVCMGRYPHLSRFQALSAQDLDLVDQVVYQTGIDHLQDRAVTELSGGEKQRVIFARALAQDTPLLLLDEATSNLDLKHGLHLMHLTRSLTRDKGTTVLAVFHDINLAATFCDELIFLQQGRICISGRTCDVLTPETIAAVFEVQAQVHHDPETNRPHVLLRPPQAQPSAGQGIN